MTAYPLELLLGDQAADLMSVALAEHGGTLHALRAANVHVQPSGAAVVRYAAGVARPDGRCATETLVATTGDRIPPEATVVAGEHRGNPVHVGIWRFPLDPALPALAALTAPRQAADLLSTRGLTRADHVDVAVRAYRPGHRAVVELTAGSQRWFVKVVRPAAVDGLRARHNLLCRHVPVPPVLTSLPAGALVLAAGAGTPLRAVLAAGYEPPSPETLGALLDALPAELTTYPRRRCLTARVADCVDVLHHTLTGRPELLCELDDLADRLADRADEPTEPVPVHGDFYEGQLMADGGRVTALLDVDTAGPGSRADEWATLIGHLAVADHARDYTKSVLTYAETRTEPTDLRRRVAAVILGLATGPFRVQHRGWVAETAARITLARTWLAG